MKKKITVLIYIVLTTILFVGCSMSNALKDDGKMASIDAKKLNVAYQYGIAYAPVVIMQEQKLIEKSYENLTGERVDVEWVQMNSGADINSGMASGNIDVGYMGVAPAINGIMKKVGYKIFTNISGQEHGLMSNASSLKQLSDLVEGDSQIALVNIGSIQHIILSEALVANGYDAHCLDAKIVAMKHPDGKTALESGNVSCHLTSNPYIYMERKNEELTEIEEISEIWSTDKSFIVGVASEQLYDDDPILYKAIGMAVKEAIDYINTNDDAAKMMSKIDGNSFEDELNYIKLGKYTVETKGIYELAVFMSEYDFIDEKPSSYRELTFDDVVGD